MNVNINDLLARFLRALSDAGVQRSGTALFDELLARHAELHRRYHTIQHIDSCLSWLDWYRGSAQHPERVELALWFHDAVYDPRRSDNEQQSAVLSRSRLAELGAPLSVIHDVAAFVLATREHRTEHSDAQLLLDLDLSVLGAPSPTFADFERLIREEYEHVPELAFAVGRAAVLRGFLTRSEIYRTPPLREELEVQARVNLERRIFELSEFASKRS